MFKIGDYVRYEGCQPEYRCINKCCKQVNHGKIVEISKSMEGHLHLRLDTSITMLIDDCCAVLDEMHIHINKMKKSYNALKEDL